MKKLIALLLVLAMAIGMVACAPAGNENKETTPKAVLALDEQGKGECPVCKESVQWTQLPSEATFDVTGKQHYYLAADFTFEQDISCLMTTIADSFVCLHLNGHTLKTGSKIWTADDASASADEKATFNIIGKDGGKLIFTGASAAANTGFEHNEGLFNLYGGSYTTEFAAGESARDLIVLSRIATFEDADIKGDVWLNSVRSMVTLKGSTSVNGLIKVAFDEREHRSPKEFVIEAGWTGTATLEVPETALVEGVLDPTRYQATGDFTGTLKLSTGETIVNSNGQLVVKQ